MSQPVFVVVQSKDDYDREQREKAVFFIRVLRWLFVASLVSIILYQFVSINVLGVIFSVVIMLFAISDFTHSRELRSYIRALFALFFGLCGILMSISVIVLAIVTKTAQSLILFIPGALLLWWSYRDLKKYTRLMDRFKHRS